MLPQGLGRTGGLTRLRKGPRRAPAGDKRRGATVTPVESRSAGQPACGVPTSNELIHRIDGTNRYVLTSDGLRVAIFYTKLYQRLLRPLLAADAPPAPPELRQGLATIDHHINGYSTTAGLRNAA